VFGPIAKKNVHVRQPESKLDSGAPFKPKAIRAGDSVALLSDAIAIYELDSALQSIRSNPRYTQNITYGRPRKGHPEGSVGAHIQELHQNLAVVAAYCRDRGSPLSDADLKRLEILIEVHDTFKGEAKKRVPIADPESHASIARAFLASIHPEKSLLDMIQLHDLPYSLHLQTKRFGDFNVARFDDLLSLIPNIELFAIFQIIDNTTKGKVKPGEVGPVEWFISELKVRGISPKLDLFAMRQKVEDSLR
jgi:hypothetical protein